MPVIVRDPDRDAAIIAMADSYLQQESILPSDRAEVYKMKMDAIKRKAGRPSQGNTVQVTEITTRVIERYYQSLKKTKAVGNRMIDHFC